MPTQSSNNNTEAKLPTGDIKVFIDAFNKDFDIKLKSLLDTQQNYKNVYADAIKITTPKVGPWPNDPKVVTIGDLFKYTFPDIESDKIVKPPDPTQYSYTDSAGWSKDLKYNKDEKIKTMYDTISRGIRSNKDINAYKALKPGITNPSLWSPGQYYFDVFMTEMLSPYGPLKKPTDANGGANAFGADVISGYSFAKTHGGSVSISFFDPSGEVELSKHRDPVDPKLDYYEFYDVLDSGYSGSGIRYIMSDITGIDINLGDSDTTAPKSFASLQTQYRSGVLSDLKQDPKFNKERGVIEDSTFTGNYEHILLYKAFVQAGDNYKAVVLPLRNPPSPDPIPTAPPPLKTPTPDALEFTFNVEKTDTFILVGGTVSPPLELIIVPNDGTTYIYSETPDTNYFEDLDDEYKETEYQGLEELEVQLEPSKSLGRITDDNLKQYDTPPDPTGQTPTGGGGGGAPGSSTYNKPTGMSAKDWAKNGTLVNGSKVPSNLSGAAKYNANVKINKTMQSEYIPVIKNLQGYTNGAKLLAIVMAQQEGFSPNTRSYKTNNPGNIGNTDSGNNKSLKTLADGIKLQLDYLTKVAKGGNSYYPIGKDYVIKPYYSPEIEANNGDGVGDTNSKAPYKGMVAYVPGYKFNPYIGKIEEFVKIYATGARTGNSYITMIVSWFRQNGYSWVNEETTLKQLVEQNDPVKLLS
jgi:hypothetical protein